MRSSTGPAALGLTAALALAAHGLALASSGETRLWATNAGWTLAGATALAGTGWAARRVRGGRVGWAWRLWAAASAAWLGGALVRDGLAAAGGSPALSAADVLWFLFPVLAVAGLACRAPGGGLTFRLFALDALPVVLLATALVWVGSGHEPDSDLSHWLLLFLYPGLYVLLALIALNLLVMRGFRRVPSNMWPLGGGFCLLAAATLLEGPQALATGAAQGHWADPLWTLGLLAVAGAGARRALAPSGFSRLASPERERGWRSLPPAAGLVGLVLMLFLVSEPYHAVLYAFVLAASLLLAVRFYLVRSATGRLLDDLVRSGQSLEREQSFVSAVVDTQGALVCVLDREGRIVRFNRACEETTGYSFAEVEGRPVWGLLLPEEAEGVERTFEELRAGHFPNVHENHWLRRDGAPRLVAWSNTVLLGEDGTVEHVIGTGIDVTERRRAERELEQARAQLAKRSEGLERVNAVVARLSTLDLEPLLQMICDGAREAIGARYAALAVLSPEGTGLERFLTSGVDEETHRRIGRLPEGRGLLAEVLPTGRPLRVDGVSGHPRSVGFPPGHPPMETFLGIAIRTEDTIHGRLYLAEKEGGFDAEDEALLTLFAREAGAAIANARSYAQSLEQRERLAEQNERLRELDRMKDEFVALISHELRTPLTSVLGYLELLLGGEVGELADEQRHFLAVVERNAQRLLRLVGDLLFIAQIEAGRLVIEHGGVDLLAVARDCVEAARPRAAGKEIELRLEGDGSLALSGDRVRLAQLLDNLVSNAIKFTGEGGRVGVRVSRHNGYAVVAVSDTGIGIGEEEKEHLFERFFRSKEAMRQAIQGTGLGLTISKAIVDAHGGTIRVESEPGAGTTFVVELPLGAEGGSYAPVVAAAGR